MTKNDQARIVQAMEMINTLSCLNVELGKKLLIEKDEAESKDIIVRMYQLTIDIEELLNI